MSNKTVRNEKRKLSATYANGIAIAVLAVGGFAQVFSLAREGESPTLLATIAVVCVLTSGILHWVARSVLGGLEE